MLFVLILTAAGILLLHAIQEYLSNLKKVGNIPGFRSCFSFYSLPGALLPTSKLNPGLSWQWLWRSTVYEHYGSRTISSISFFPGTPLLCTSSLDVARQVLTADAGYWKAPDSTAALMLWGDNIISSNYGAYKRHRRVVGPAFTGSTYALVARETVTLYHEMVESEGWGDMARIDLNPFNRYMAKFALGIITRCGFGLPYHWTASGGGGGEMSFEEALQTVSENAVIRLATPAWAYKLPIKRLRTIDEAYCRLGGLMNKLIVSRRSELELDTESPHVGKHDLFTRMVHASISEGKAGLGEKELVGDVFAFLFAGHETTAHVSSATIALLALHQDEQADVASHVSSVLNDGRDPTVDDYDKLYKVVACFQEAARMFPAGSVVTRDTTETVTIQLSKGGRNLAVEPGVRIFIDMVGIHYDPETFADPERFKPSRWYGAHEPDLTVFGLGPRACLGRKFSMMEAVCLLSLLLRDWKVGILLLNEETEQQWKDRVLQGSLIGLGFGIQNAPITLAKRTHII